MGDISGGSDECGSCNTKLNQQEISASESIEKINESSVHRNCTANAVNDRVVVATDCNSTEIFNTNTGDKSEKDVLDTRANDPSETLLQTSTSSDFPLKVNTMTVSDTFDSASIETVPVLDSVSLEENSAQSGNLNMSSCDTHTETVSGDVNAVEGEQDNEQLSDSSGQSECEYESAEEGEEIKTDAENLRKLEECLTDEQKEERREEAQELKASGNEMFRNGSYKSAINAYSRALRTCPLKFAKDRAIMYSNRAACKMRLEENDDCIRDCSKAIELNPQYLKAVMRRAELYEKTDKLDEALEDYKKILELDPSQHTARAACIRLPEQINERNEKMKEEMMGKLKDLGNMVLRPFGLSTNNFKLNQDPNTGGYSVNFVQNTEQEH